MLQVLLERQLERIEPLEDILQCSKLFLSWGQFSKELPVCFTSRTLVFTSPNFYSIQTFMYNVTSLQLVHTMAFYRIRYFRVGLYMLNLQMSGNLRKSVIFKSPKVLFRFSNLRKFTSYWALSRTN